MNKIKIGIFLEGSPSMGGGFFQSLKACFLLMQINNFNQNMEIIITDELAVSYFKQKKIKIQKFVSNIFTKYFSELFEIDLIRDLFYKLKINHPFYKLTKKENYDLIIFLGPSLMAKYCSDTSFIFNIWDLDHKKNTQFPEHKYNYYYEKKEKLLKETLSRAFKIIVPHKSNKKDLMNLYKVPDETIITQNFIPVLPQIYSEKKIEGISFQNIYKKLNLPEKKKIIYYPAQFWAHKNHKYIIDAARILKKKENDDYFFVFSGNKNANYQYIYDLIKTYELENYIKIFSFINDEDIISMYLNCDAIVMPTYCGPTNLPIYESFYFKKIIFYSKELIPDDNINQHLIQIDLNSPIDLCEKLLILKQTNKINKIVEDNYKFYEEVCDEKKFLKNYEEIFKKFSYLNERWK